MSILLLRHGTAGTRKRWAGSDLERPLDKRGRRQARHLVELLEGYPIGRILTSPYTRCVATVEPLTETLGIGVEPFSTAMAVANLIWGIGAVFAGMIADRYGAGRVVMGGIAATIAGLYIMFAARSPSDLMLSGVLLGIGVSGTGLTALVGAAGRAAPPEKRTAAIASLGMASGIGGFISGDDEDAEALRRGREIANRQREIDQNNKEQQERRDFEAKAREHNAREEQRHERMTHSACSRSALVVSACCLNAVAASPAPARMSRPTPVAARATLAACPIIAGISTRSARARPTPGAARSA